MSSPVLELELELLLDVESSSAVLELSSVVSVDGVVVDEPPVELDIIVVDGSVVLPVLVSPSEVSLSSELLPLAASSPQPPIDSESTTRTAMPTFSTETMTPKYEDAAVMQAPWDALIDAN